MGKYAPVSPERVRFHAGAILAGTAKETKQKQMDKPLIDQTIESIAQETLDTISDHCHPAIFLVNDTGGVARRPDIEERVSVIREELNKERERVAVEEHALATEELFEALVAQGVTEIEISFSLPGESSFKVGDGTLEIVNMKRDKAIVAEDEGVLTVTDEATFLEKIAGILMYVLNAEWPGWGILNDSVSGDFVVDVSNRTIHLDRDSLSGEFEHMPFAIDSPDQLHRPTL